MRALCAVLTAAAVLLGPSLAIKKATPVSVETKIDAQDDSEEGP